jgi:hypothetical protein
MTLRGWLNRVFFHQSDPLALYKRGMARARKHNHQGAIEDYTAVIDLPGVAADLSAMVRYNRALVYVAIGEERKGIDDLETVLAMSEPLTRIKTMASQKLARMESRAGKQHTQAPDGTP